MLEKLFSYRNIVMIVLIVINITITATQSEFDEYGSDSGSFEDFIFTDGNSRETKESHAATVNFLHHSKPDKNECPLCYVRSRLGRCVKICNTKDIEKYTERSRHYDPNKTHKESKFITVQRHILDIWNSLFEDSPQYLEKRNAALKWLKDLFESYVTNSSANSPNTFVW